jgi:hypothetical protein
MNARIERAMNSKNFDTRITENRALDQKIWLWKLSGENGIFRRFWGVFVEF